MVFETTPTRSGTGMRQTGQALTQGIKNGMDYANTKRKLDLLEEQAESEEARLKQEKEMAMRETALTGLENLYKATNNEYSGKVRKAYVDQFRNKMKVMGVQVQDEALVAAMGDPDQSQKVAETMKIAEQAILQGSPEQAAGAARDLIEIWGSGQGLETIEKLYEKRDEIRKQLQEQQREDVVREDEQEFEMEKLGIQEGGKQRRAQQAAEAKAEREALKAFDDYGKRAKDIEDTYNAPFRALDQINQIERSPDKFDSATFGGVLVESIKGLSDVKIGVVREGERKAVEQSQSFLGRIYEQFKGITGPINLDPALVQDIIQAKNTLKRPLYKTKADQIGGFIRRAKARGLGGKIKDLLGPKNTKDYTIGQYYKAVEKETDMRGEALLRSERQELAKAYGLTMQEVE